MNTEASTSIDITSWDEHNYDSGDEATPLARAVVTGNYTGDLVGAGRLELLLVYLADGTASYVGHERVVGILHGRQGSFVLRHTGTFHAGAAHTDWEIVPGSGTGELTGLAGSGGYQANEGSTIPTARLTYALTSSTPHDS
ncbi:uncharacterized protein DUF3224 [Tamaricihabitans halophyticus]|uniref:Uncharacterized protein DUF3224 n=1 Tax=Tamaricihabitans halophyticus TaxID=1262583 RepID=A0A4R2QQE9_9PSEU|nr:DUF3224 domain-containing protein [Tamaricihabitans halophyticus]TCP49261.1 uncharacterized protein DUF3224 [Tamaricihabitans halophyticus]